MDRPRRADTQDSGRDCRGVLQADSKPNPLEEARKGSGGPDRGGLADPTASSPSLPGLESFPATPSSLLVGLSHRAPRELVHPEPAYRMPGQKVGEGRPPAGDRSVLTWQQEAHPDMGQDS